MSALTRKCLGIYIVLLFGLSMLGRLNQGLYVRQDALIAEKAILEAQLRELRAAAAPVNGPQGVSAWARANGMVPATQAPQSRTVAPGPTPSFKPDTPTVEVYTLWR